MAWLRRIAPLTVVGLVACFITVDDYPVGDVDTNSSSSAGGGPASSTSTSTSSSTTTGGGGGAGPMDGRLGEPCDANNFCAPPLACVPESDEDAGPPRGVCTKSCANDDECPDEGYCALVMPGFGTCTLRCTIGDDDSDKCRGRRDMACSVILDLDSNEVEICRPLCNDDADCVTGRECDRRTGLCAVKSTGNFGQVGVGCNPSFDLCRGACTMSTQACREDCVVGAPKSCTPTNASARCILPAYPSYPTPGVGDRGRCARECLCDDECGGTELCNVEVQGTRFCTAPSNGAGMPCPSN